MCERDSGGGGGTWCQRRRLVSSKCGNDASAHLERCSDSTKDENNNDMHYPMKKNEESFHDCGNNSEEHRLSFSSTDYNNNKRHEDDNLNSSSKKSGSTISSSNKDLKSQFIISSKITGGGEGLALRKQNTHHPHSHLVPPVVLMILAGSLVLLLLLPNVASVCVWQGGGSFRLACGFRQSGLFRIRSLGGLKGYLGGGFTIGDEDGFKDSLTNTDPVNKNTNYAHPSQGQVYPNGYQRVGQGYEPLPTPLPFGSSAAGGNGGVPLSLEELKKQEQLRYLQQIQAEQMLQHQVLQQQASMQGGGRQQKQLFQSRRLPLPHPSQQSSMPQGNKSGGGITKRASRWGWPFQKKGPNNGGHPINPGNQNNGGRRMMNQQQIRPSGPPPIQNSRGRGPPPQPQQGHRQNMMAQQSQVRPVLMRGPPPGQGQPNKNPFHNQQGPFPRQFQQFPLPQQRSGPHPHPISRQGHLSQNNEDNDYFDSEDQIAQPSQTRHKLPPQMMMPPPNGGSSSGQQFRQQQQFPHPHEDIRHLQLPPSPSPSQIPHGLQMLQNTENYGSVFQLVDTNHQPKNFQNSENLKLNLNQHVHYPSSLPTRPQSHPPSPSPTIHHQNQVHRTLSTEMTREEEEQEQEDQQLQQEQQDRNFYLTGLGNLDPDALRTAVYDPNIFPDIYFTTTERGAALGSGVLSSPNRHTFSEDEDFLLPQSQPMDTAALHTNENVDRIMEETPLNAGSQDGQSLTIDQDQGPISSPSSDFSPPRRKKGKRRKKFRILKKTGQVNSDVSQNLDLDDLGTDEASASGNANKGGLDGEDGLNPNRDGSEGGGGEIVETTLSDPGNKKLRRRKKGRRRKKKPIGYRVKNSTATTTRSKSESELIREAISSSSGEKLPIQGPSPLTLTFPADRKVKIKSTTPTTTISTSTSTTTTTTTTTTPEPKISKFGYHEALDKKPGDKDKKKKKNPFDRDFSSTLPKYQDNEDDASSLSYSKSQSVEQAPYDPRFPPSDPRNKGRIPNKFVRPRGGGSAEYSSTSTTTPTPFLSGGLNVLTPGLSSGPSLSFSSSNSNYNSKTKSKKFYELESPGSTAETVKFSPSTELSSSFVRFDSRESIKSIERTKLHNDKFYSSHFNKSAAAGSREKVQNNFGPTAFSHPGYYDGLPQYSQERESEPRSRYRNHDNKFESTRINAYPNHGQNTQPPPRPPPSEQLLPWEQAPSFFSSSSTTTGPSSFNRSPVPIYPRKSNTVVFDRFGPTSPSITYPTTSPSSSPPDLKKNLFGDEDDDHLNNWEAPNFWGSIQQVDRYGPTSDFVTNDNFKRVLEQEEDEGRNSFDHNHDQGRDREREQQGPSLRPPPEPPITFDNHQLGNFHSFFDSTPNSLFHPEEEEGEKWDSQRKLDNHHHLDKHQDKHHPLQQFPTSPSPFYNPSSTTTTKFHPDLEAFEQLPVKELDLEDFGPMNNFNFISSTSTTQTPEVIKNIRIKHARGKKRKQKRPEVSIKNRGDNQPEQPDSGSSTPMPTHMPTTPTATPTPIPIQKLEVQEDGELVDIITRENGQDSKSSFTVGQSIGLTGTSGSGGSEVRNSIKINNDNIAQNGFDGNFIPSSTPFMKEGPFSNFDSVIPQNPFAFTNSKNRNGGGGILSSSDLNRHINQMTGFDGGQGQNQPHSPVLQQHRESSEERRQFAQPNEIPQFGPPQREQPNLHHHPDHTSEDVLANIVPSPPDPMLNSKVVPFEENGNDEKRFEFQFPTSVPVLRLPGFSDNSRNSNDQGAGSGGGSNGDDLRWDLQKHNDNNNRMNIDPPPQRKILPQSIQILNIQNQPTQQQQPQPPKMPQMNNDFYGTDFRNFQQQPNFQNQQPGSFNQKHQLPQNFDLKMNNPPPNQQQQQPFKNNIPPPSIKLVRPNQQNQNQNQNYFQGPPLKHSNSQQQNKQQFPFEEHLKNFKMFKMPQKQPNQFQSQQQQQQPRDREPQPFQLIHPVLPPPNKAQFQKNAPPKKYQQQQDNMGNNIQLPKNPYMNNMNNLKQNQPNPNNQQNSKPTPTKIPAQKFLPPLPPTPAPSFLSRLNPFRSSSSSNSNSQGSSSSNSNNNNKQNQQSNLNNKGPNSNNNPWFSAPKQQPQQPSKSSPPSKGVEVTYVDLDDNLNPPRMVPHSSLGSQGGRQQNPHQNPHQHPPPPPPRSRGPPFPPQPPTGPHQPRREDPRSAGGTGPMSEKDKVLQAIATLNNVKYDVIQSVAEEQFGTEILERIKAKKAQEEHHESTTTTPRPSIFPILTTMAPMAGSFLNMMGSAANAAADSIENGRNKILQSHNKRFEDVHQNQRMSPTGLSNLLASFGGYGDSAAPLPPRSNPTITSLSTDAITNLFNSLTSGENGRFNTPRPTVPVTTTTTTTTAPPPPSNLAERLDTMIENSGGSMELINLSPNQDIKSLQAQLAKAILAKANRKKNSGYGNPGPSPSSPSPSPNPLGLINNLAQTKNYTQSQIATLKKLIALNNIEQKLNHQLGLGGMDQTTPKFGMGLGHTMKSLLAPSGPSPSTFSNKMLQDPDLQMLNTVQSSGGGGNGLHNDPTLLALKAYALKKAQSIQLQQQQPNVSVNVRRQPEYDESSTDFKPIPVDLSAILSPAPPLEEPRKRRLTDVRNAPKSFYPANATLGFDNIGSGPGAALSTEFSCEEQNFFPGLYADTGLGCKVFHLCAKTDAGYLMKSFRCPKETVFDNEVLKCNWSLYVNCEGSESKYHFNKYLSQSFQFLKVLGEFNKNATAANG